MSAAKQINIDFITTENIEMIWEIILDDIKERLKSQEQFARARAFFINQARSFFEREKTVAQNLMQMNKKFISQIMQSFNEPVKQQQPPPTFQQPPTTFQQNQLFKAEDIQAERISAFEKNLEAKKNDFLNAITVPVPEAPKFSDNNLDKPIGSAMGELIARTLAQRNFEIEELHKTANKDDVEKFLRPAETSVKSEKIQQKQQNNVQMEEKQKQYDYQYKNQVTPKLIQIGDELPTNKKQISWGENKEYEVNEINFEVREIEMEQNQKMGSNIFSKLKYVASETSPKITNDIENKGQKEIKSEIKVMNDKINSLENKMNKILELLQNKNDNNNNNKNNNDNNNNNNNNKIEPFENNNIESNYTEE